MPGSTLSTVPISSEAEDMTSVMETKNVGSLTVAEGGRSIVLTRQRQDHGMDRGHKLSEATEYALRYQKLVLKATADPECWFSLYELVKMHHPEEEALEFLSLQQLQW